MSQPGGAAAPQADGASAAGRKGTSSRERLKRSQKSTKVEGPELVCAEASLIAEQGTMTEVKVKTELPDDYIQEVIWQGEAKEEKKAAGKDGTGDVPAEICVVIGGVRNQQTLGSYECGICGKKYKYYNCFQTHVRAHRDTEATSGEGASQSNNFRYTCDICGKKYKYYSCFQEHRDLHAVDVFSVEGAPENRADPFDQGVVATDEVKEEPPEPFQKIGPKTGNYTCEFCGKQYKYYTPYQEHVALHAPIMMLSGSFLRNIFATCNEGYLDGFHLEHNANRAAINIGASLYPQWNVWTIGYVELPRIDCGLPQCLCHFTFY